VVQIGTNHVIQLMTRKSQFGLIPGAAGETFSSEGNRFINGKFVGKNSGISGTNRGTVNGVRRMWNFEHYGARETYTTGGRVLRG